MYLQRTLLFLLFSTLAFAQAIGFGIGITAQNNEALTLSNPNYNTLTEQYTVTGTVTLPVGTNAADFQVRLQNQFTTMTPVGASTTNFQFSRPIPMGPTAPPGGWSGWAYADHYTNDDRITRPIIAELIKNTTNEVFARTRVVMLDNRRHVNMTTKSSAASIPSGLAFEVTSRGLDALQPLLRSASPQPSLSTFNGRLTEAFVNYENSTTLDTTLTNAARACVPVSDLPSEYRQTPAFLAFSAEVAAAYAAYQVADAILNNTAAPALAVTALTPAAVATLALQGGAFLIERRSCVRELPTFPRMELCARSLKGNTRSMSITGLGAIDLQMGTTIDLSPPNLLALNTVANPTGVLDGSATDFFFRYSHDPGRNCSNNSDTYRPTTDLPANQIPATSTMDTFRSCPGITISANNASQTVGSTFEFRAHTGNDTNPELHRVEHLTSPNRIFTLSTATSKDAYKGLCNRTQFRPGADTLADKFFNRLRNSLDTAWKRDDPQTQQSKAIDLVFSKWETGTFGDSNLLGTPTGADHVLTHTYNLLESKNLTDRFFLRYDTSTLSTGVGNAAGAFVDSKAEIIPCSSLNVPCNNNRNRFGNPFDVSYTVTTSALNEMLRRLATTNLITLDWQPTYDEIGITPPVGTPSTAIAVLNGTNLAQIDPAFIVLGNNAATIRFTPTINPYTYINPEPPSTVPEGTENLTYNLPQYKMELLTTAPGPLGDGKWIEAVIDFHDPELDLRLANGPSVDRLVPTMSGQRSSRALVLRHAFAACPIGPLVAPIQLPPPNPVIPHPVCGDQLAGSLFNRFRPILLDRLTYMLSRFPAPVVFNANGQGNNFLVNPTDRYQWTNSITFYGNIQ
jgi:hypothetical protein